MKKKIQLSLFLILICSVWINAKSSNDDLKLWYTRPASKWLEALPIGNGSLGGMVFGGVEQEHIQFNEESLITGTTQTVGFYQPFGDVFIDFIGLRAENYIRELDLNEGIHKVGFSSNGVIYQRECFASYPDKTMVLHLTASKKGMISGTIRLTDAHQAMISISGNKLTASGKLTENQMEYESQIQVLNKGGKLISDANGIEIQGASEVTILIVAGTSFLNDHRKDFKGEHPHAALTKRLADASAKTAMVSLNARGDVSTGWSTAWKINLFARLGEGNRSYDLIRQLFRQCILENMFDTHPPFQIDGNFGYTAGVAEMLLQSHIKEGNDYILQLLPALPDPWNDGEMKGLRARGGFVVDIKWETGKIVECKIKSHLGNILNINYSGKNVQMITVSGRSYQIDISKLTM